MMNYAELASIPSEPLGRSLISRARPEYRHGLVRICRDRVGQRRQN